MIDRTFLPVLALFVAPVACTPPEAPSSVSTTETLFATMPADSTGITFENRIDETEQLNLFMYEYLYNGGGVAVGDINNDGLIDLYFVSNLGADALYLNKGGFRFEDISAQAGIAAARGYKTGVTMVDVNGDGLLDIHVCRSGLSDPALRPNLLYINNGDLTFTERAAEYGLDDRSYSTQAYFHDLDLDGDLDLFLLNHPAEMRKANELHVTRTPDGQLTVAVSSDLTYISDRLYRNDGGRFHDVTAQAGLLNEAFGLSAIVADLNDDRLPDIYVGNDYSRPDFLYIANGDGSYSERFEEHFRHSALSTMGADLGDVNNDGCPDLVTLDMVAADRYRYQMLSAEQNYDRFARAMEVGLGAQLSTNTLQLAQCNGQFSDIAFLANVAYTDWSWSALFADLDNDGWKDLLVTNSLKRDLTNNDFKYYVRDSIYREVQAGRATIIDLLNAIPSVPLRSHLFRNRHDLTFADATGPWNSGPPGFNNGAAQADLDNDGRLDLVINNLNSTATVLRNTGAGAQGNGYLRFALEDGNRPVRGAEVQLTTSEGLQVQHLRTERGFLSCSEPVVHFGISAGTTVQEARITWPDGAVQTLSTPALNTVHRVSKAVGLPRSKPAPQVKGLFVDRSDRLPKGFGHAENTYIDFKREPLLHHELSEDGPAVAVGDVNGDGLDDVYVGGAMDHAGRILLQGVQGRFAEQPEPAFKADAIHEDAAAIFLDAEGDGDLDLYVGSGGNERPAYDAAYQDRLYLNDGRGRFTRTTTALPDDRESTGAIAAADMDGDGDTDLFVGARSTPGRYPEPPRSRLLRNDGGRFTDVTSEWSAGLERIGMVTAGLFSDLDKDGTPELVIAGEWMPVTVFDRKDDQWVNATTEWGLDETHGWWNALDAADLNGDGFPELVAGNLGLNSVFKAGPDAPITLHYKDYDSNGSMDAVLCRSYNGVAYPVHTRDRMRDQLVMLRKRFQRYHPYAMASFEEVFTTAERRDERVLRATHFANTLFLNQGGRRLEGRPLPNLAQLSAARAIRFGEVDGDGRMDLVVAGNFHGTDPQFGRLDASIGLYMKGDGRGGLEPWPAEQSGLSVPGNVRAFMPLRTRNGRYWLVVRNNARATLLETTPAISELP